MKTKQYHRFLNRVAQYEADIETADVIQISSYQGKLHTPGSGIVFDAVDKAKHPRLAVRSDTAYSRKMIIRHLKTTVFSSFVKDLYEDLAAYLQGILFVAAKNSFDPNRLIGEHKLSLDANELLQAGSWPAVVKLVTDSVFRKLENEKATKDLIIKIDAKLNLGINKPLIDAALPYLEIRHLLVHADGVTDKAFCAKFAQFNVTPGAKIRVDYKIAQDAKLHICALASAIDKKIVKHGILPVSELST